MPGAFYPKYQLSLFLLPRICLDNLVDVCKRLYWSRLCWGHWLSITIQELLGREKRILQGQLLGRHCLHVLALIKMDILFTLMKLHNAQTDSMFIEAPTLATDLKRNMLAYQFNDQSEHALSIMFFSSGKKKKTLKKNILAKICRCISYGNALDADS